MCPMCGICGSTADPDGAAVARMCDAMLHRGPDDSGVYRDPATALSLGARRLSIIDLAGGHQPVSNEDGTVWAALNGEIYNHPALQKRLRSRGHQLRSETDTEVLVHLYEDFGYAMVHALDGMYAFAVWDSRRGSLLIARDRFGEKPLFYTARDGALAFASELSALRKGMNHRPEIDPTQVDSFFVLGYVAGEHSLLDGVHQLPPSHQLTWSIEDPVPRVSRYWALPERALQNSGSASELLEEAEMLLRRTVRSRLLADVPVGVFLSGGVDSTLVAAIAAQESGAPLKAFTVAYDVGDVSEDAAARTAATALGLEHHVTVLTSDGVASEVDHLLRRLDLPNADPALVALGSVARFAREQVTVAIGGEGADEIFGGYPRYRWLERATQLQARAPHSVDAAAAMLGRRELTGRSRRVADLLNPHPLAEAQVDWVTSGRRHMREQIYGQRLREQSESTVAVDDAGAILGSGDPRGVADRLMRLDSEQWLPDDVLYKADRASMLHSLEVRTPFLGREVSEFAAGVPTRVHLQNHGKSLVRGVLERVSPGIGGQHRKTAFRVPLAQWLRGPLWPLVEHHTQTGCLIREQWMNGSHLGELARRHRAGADNSAVLWPAIVLGAWLDEYGCE